MEPRGFVFFLRKYEEIGNLLALYCFHMKDSAL